MDDVLTNPWTITIVGGVVVGLVLYYVFGIGKDNGEKTNKNSHNNNRRESPSIEAGGNITAGRDIIVGGQRVPVDNKPQETPEFHLQLYGSGAKLSFEGHIEKNSSITLTILYLEIDGIRTNINQSFTKLAHLKDLNFDQTIFTRRKKKITVSVYYRNLAGRLFKYSQSAEQETRSDKRFNVKLLGTPKVEQITDPTGVAKFIETNDWIAKPTNEDQGTDLKELSLAGNSLDKLIFCITPTTPFWRAGFKLFDPNSSAIPLRNSDSLLFHLGSTDDGHRLGMTTYINGDHVGAINKTKKFELGNPVEIGVEISKKNFVKIYVDNALEFEPTERIDPRLTKRACLLAWGDGQNYSVKFERIMFSVRD